MLLLLTVLVALATTAQCQSCRPQFEAYGGSCYHFSATRIEWFDADELCTSFQVGDYSASHLVSIESYGEDTWIAQKIKADNDFSGRDVWIGASKVDKNVGQLVWIKSYKQLSYTNWSPSRPGDGKCAYMNEYYSYKWDNGDCDNKKAYVCEYTPKVEEKQVIAPAPEEGEAMACSPGFIASGRSCYYFIPTSLNWYDADQYCTYVLPGTSYNVHLASVESAQEQNFLGSHIAASSTLRGRNYWVSGNKLDKKRGWHWASTNTDVSYTAWAPSQPDDSGKCVFLYNSQNYLWDDYDCMSTRAGFTNLGFVCEYLAW